MRFCVNTFEWGDYINEVWDLWYYDKNGVLIVAEDEDPNIHNKKLVIAVSHASLCPNNKQIWLEGVRVHPNYRRRSIATELLNKMISYGKEQGANEASAMVAANNIASQLMMKTNGFTVLSKWSYYGTDKIPKEVDKVKLRSKYATFKDTEIIYDYLRRSEVYKSSGRTYVNSWRWYSLDLCSNILSGLVMDKKVIVVGNDLIEGLAIINKDIHWNKSNTFQIVYLDSSNMNVLEDLIGFTINLIHSYGATYDRLQVYSPQITEVSTVMEQVGLERPEQFLLYSREI